MSLTEPSKIALYCIDMVPWMSFRSLLFAYISHIPKQIARFGATWIKCIMIQGLFQHTSKFSVFKLYQRLNFRFESSSIWKYTEFTFQRTSRFVFQWWFKEWVKFLPKPLIYDKNNNENLHLHANDLSLSPYNDEVYISLLIFLQNIDFGCLFKMLHWGSSNKHTQSLFGP